MKSITLRIPASTSNLGPGFDCLGIALSLYNLMTFEVLEGTDSIIEVEGEGSDILTDPTKNLVLKAFRTVYEKSGKTAPAVKLKQVNNIPLERGLGSSAVAYIGGLVAANYFLGSPYTQKEILEMGVRYEGHPDNICPSYLGGFIIAAYTPEGTFYTKCNNLELPQVLVAIPELEMNTKQARKALPSQIGYKDAVQNINRATLLVAALMQGDWENIRVGMEDRLHQPYRDTAEGFIAAAVKAAVEAGAYGAALSGAGSTIFCFVSGKNPKIETALSEVFRERGIKVSLSYLEIDHEGLILTENN